MKKVHQRAVPLIRIPALPAAAIILALALATGTIPARADAEDATKPLNDLPEMTSAPEIADENITAAVSTALLIDPGVVNHLVDVQTEDGIVTLSGSVNTILASDRAVAVTETVKGVRSVINRITVNAPSRADDEIQRDVEKALLLDPATDSYEIEVSVDDGTVLLRGRVDSWQEKQLAATVARGVSGVTALRNAIEISYVEERFDEEIEADIEAALKWDALVDHALVDVSVEDGAVALSGIVGSAAEARQAFNDAWVAGVTAVDRSALIVDPLTERRSLRENKYTPASDEEIRTAILDAFLQDPRVNMFNVDVSVEDGSVTLEGKVDNLKAKRAASRNAGNTTGVWSVDNRLLVRAADIPADLDIADTLEAVLLRDPLVQRHDLRVSVVNGEVFLGGTVDTYYEKMAATDAASAVPGVIQVTNNIEVSDRVHPLTHDPYVDRHWGYGDLGWYYDTRVIRTRLSDWQISTAIRDELWWSPFVDEDQVTVSVDDGEATLTGTVDTWSERAAAEKNAYDGGAVSVDNDLRVIHGPAYYQK